MGIFGTTKSRKFEMERNSFYFFWKRGYELLDDFWDKSEISDVLNKMNGNNCYIDIQGNRQRSFIMGRTNAWDLVFPAFMEQELYRAKKGDEYIIFGILGGAYVTVIGTNSNLARTTEMQRNEYQNKTAKIITDIENDEELKECLGYRPRRYHF